MERSNGGTVERCNNQRRQLLALNRSTAQPLHRQSTAKPFHRANKLVSPFYVTTWVPRREIISPEGAPEDCYRLNSGRVAGENVVNRVADENGVLRCAVEAVQCYPYGFGIGLVSSRGIAADDGVHVSGEAHVREAANGERLRLARHDAELMASTVKLSNRLGDAVIAAGEPVVVRELVFAVGSDQRGAVGLVTRISAEHREQRNADSGQPFLIGRARAVELRERVASRVQDQLDRVDECPVEIEQDGGGAAGHGHQ